MGVSDRSNSGATSSEQSSVQQGSTPSRKREAMTLTGATDQESPSSSSSQPPFEKRRARKSSSLADEDSQNANARTNDSETNSFSRIGVKRSLALTSLSSTSSSRSHLFPDVDDASTILAPASILPQGTYNSPSKPQRMSSASQTSQSTSSSSLFGAVMKSVSQSQQQQLPDPSTPQASFRQFVASPGGFQLLDFVNSVASPFDLAAKSKQHSATSTPASVTSPPRTEWYQTTLTDNSIRLVDWTLKSQFQVKFQPTWTGYSCNAVVQQEALQQFLTPNVPSFTTTQTKKPQHAASVQWHEGLLFWQHPSSGQFTDAATSDHENKRLVEASSLSNMSWRGKMPPPPKQQSTKSVKDTTKLSAKSVKDTNKPVVVTLDPRQREWQEAFQSLQTNWIQRIRHLAENDSSNQQDVVDTYFYSVGKGHTVLFRVGASKETTSCTDDSDSPVLVPEIVLSSSTLALRDKLRTIGARWWLLAEFEGHKGEFDEKMLRSRSAPTKSTAESPSVNKADLIALRRAQAFRQTAGADVSISMRSRSNNVAVTSPNRVPPLVLSGMDDCLAFCEVYRNALGQISTGQPWRAQNLPASEAPLLLCRKLGPFLHSTLSQSTCKRPTSASFHVSGVLLPCAVRSLICAAAHAMMEEAPQDESAHDNAAESCHAIVQLTPHTNKTAVVGLGSIGDCGSKLFNSREWMQHEAEDDYRNCRYQEMVQTVVWDMDRPSDLAYKLDLTSSLL